MKPEQMRMIFAANLTHLRKEKGWTSEKTAKELNIKFPAYRKYEEGRALPKLPVLIQICQIFDFPDIATLFTQYLENEPKKALKRIPHLSKLKIKKIAVLVQDLLTE
jgi:transcriptional regulator with XRE-family HTH domain